MRPGPQAALGVLVCVLLPLGSWVVDGRGELAYTMYARTLAYRLDVTAIDATGARSRTRAAGVVAGLCALAVASQDAFGFKFTLYTLFVGTTMVALSDAGQSLALRPSAPTTPPAGPQLVRWFVASVYGWSGIAKLRPAWLSGDTLRAFHDGHYLSGGLADRLFGDPTRCRAAAWAVVVVELLLGPLLLTPRTRRAGLVLALGMHTVYELTARPDVFGWVMGALLLSFLGGGGDGGKR